MPEPAQPPEPVKIEVVVAEVMKALLPQISARFDSMTKALPDLILPHFEPITAQLTSITEKIGQTPTPPSDGKGAIPPEVNAQIKAMSETVRAQGAELQSLKAAKETAEKRAEETERHSAVRTALMNLPFVNDRAAETAFSIVSPFVRRLDDGSLVAGSTGGENFPIPSFVKDVLEKDHSYLFKPTGAGGSGAPASAGNNRGAPSRFDIGQIAPGMTPEKRAEALAAIVAAIPQAS